MDDVDEALMRKAGPIIDALLELPRADAEAAVAEWQRRAPAAIVDDPGPEAMLAGLRVAYEQAIAKGLRPVGILACRRHSGGLLTVGRQLAQDEPVGQLELHYTCRTKDTEPSCTCERAKGPALAVASVMEVPVVRSIYEQGLELGEGPNAPLVLR
jgi:hypothetical protein